MRWLSRPRAPLFVIAVALALALPSLSIGFFSDDHALIDYLEHRAPHSPPWWDLYRFTPGTDAGVEEATAAGQMPWWTTPALRLHFVRPFPSALLALDLAVSGHHPLAWHVHSLLWYAALLFVVNALFRRLLPAPTATLALLVFALSDATVFPFAWPSARYGLPAALCAAAAVMAHVRWRREGWSAGRWVTPLWLVLGLLSGESALGGFAFVVAYDLIAPGAGSLRARVWKAAPLTALASAYLLLYGLVGGGAHASTGYVSPLSEPAAFLAAAVTRIPTMVGDAIVGVPSEAATIGLGPRLAVAGAVATVLFVLFWRACLTRIPARERADLPWLALGGCVALLAGVGGFPGARELLIPNLGFAPILAVLLAHAFEGGRLAVVRRVGGSILALVHLVLLPLNQVGNQRAMALMEQRTEVAARAAETGAPRIFLVAGSDPMVGMYVPAVMSSEGRGPVCWAWLSGARAPVALTRTGAASFALEAGAPGFLRGAFETLFRAPSHPMRAGDEVTVCGARVRAASVDDGRPARIEVDSDVPLDDPSASWLVWAAGKLQHVAFPPLGASTTIAWTPGPSGVF
jgi:hypothetical protein